MIGMSASFVGFGVELSGGSDTVRLGSQYGVAFDILGSSCELCR